MCIVMKTLALTSSVFVLTAAGAMAQQADIELLRARADAQERRISQLEIELSRLRSYQAEESRPKAVPMEPASEPSESTEYIVQKGDVLTRIAKRHNTTVDAIKRANGLEKDHIFVGQKLRVPGADKAVAVLEPLPPVPTVKSGSSHLVQSGETFYSIARQHNVSVSSLVKANPEIDPRSMQVGQKLSLDVTPRSAVESRRATSRPDALPKPKSKTQEVASRQPAKRKAVSQPVKKSEPEIRTITVHRQMTYGKFASKHGASTNQLNELNGLSLSKNTMLAIGSELYVPKY